jgi:molybdopterin-guanine dinucleotide biosynthesis protein A
MSTPRPVTGYVLAGGASRRMGRDKALLPWAPSPLTLLDHMVQLLAHVCEPVHIVGRGPIMDVRSGLGPLGGITTALRQSQTAENIIVAVDLPFLTVDFLKYFKERSQGSQFQLTACKIRSSFPLCLGIRTELAAALEAYIDTGDRSVHGFIEGHPAEILALEQLQEAGFKGEIFANINTQADYEAALSELSREIP